MVKINCWEFKKCGCQPGGANAEKCGVCTAATEKRTEGINHGKNGGRACWAIMDTLCDGEKQASFAVKLSKCLSCEFYKVVRQEEGSDFVGAKTIMSKIK
ncbi:MAG: two-CW domain-containing protein [Candidatus Omnitrophota bacterium]